MLKYGKVRRRVLAIAFICSFLVSCIYLSRSYRYLDSDTGPEIGMNEPIKKYTKKAFLVEPDHKRDALAFVIENALENLPNDWQVLTILPPSTKSFFQDLCSSNDRFVRACETNRLVRQELDTPNPTAGNIYDGHHWRNKLFGNADFWKGLDAEWLLAIQADTIICQKGEPPLVFNYIGGPSYLDQKVYDNEMDFIGHFNGGFSLRNTAWTIQCIRAHQDQVLVEDTLFSQCYNEDKIPYKMGDVLAFSSDNGHHGCFWRNGTRTCPYGMHKVWARKNIDDAQYQELFQYCPAAKKLAQIQGQ